ncbi:hypothetical protein BH11BAC2_BH11BAC2_05020 [soil metagenome]
MINPKTLRFSFWSLTAALLISLAFTACRKDDFDAPPSNGVDPNLTANISIKEFKDLYYDTIINNGAIVPIDSDYIISGVITADDKSGNYYKTLVMQDSTAGIAIRLDISNFYTEYAIGRRVFVKLKGMVIGDYGNLIQLGGYKDTLSGGPASVAPIPASLVRKYLYAGVWGTTLTPEVVSIGQLNNTRKYQNMLVEIPSVQFIPFDTAQPWADAITFASVNRRVQDCYSGEIDIRTSGYSNFASVKTPVGSGNLTGIMSVYNSSLQFIVRDQDDAAFDAGRFVVGTCPLPPTQLASISDIRNQYSGSAGSIAGNLRINGVVISDINFANSDPKNLYIQDATGGIVVRFTAAHALQLGDSVEINVTGQSLSEYNGLLEIGGSSPSVPVTNAIKVGTGTIVPRPVTIAQILSNMAGSTDTWESTLVTVSNVTITGAGTTYNGNTTVTDATGSLSMFTRSAATFSATTFPTGTVNITGIISDFNAAQIFIRSTTDVQ